MKSAVCREDLSHVAVQDADLAVLISDCCYCVVFVGVLCVDLSSPPIHSCRETGMVAGQGLAQPNCLHEKEKVAAQLKISIARPSTFLYSVAARSLCA